MTPAVTRFPDRHDTLILAPGAVRVMHCDFCASSLPDVEPENLTLLAHLGQNKACNEQYGFLLDNLRTSWTRNMSGG